MEQEQWIKMANCIFELEKKLQQKDNGPGTQRLLDKMKALVLETGLLILNPLGETFSETRTDVEATITGASKGAMKITDVLKPVIYATSAGRNVLVQKGVVLVS